MPPARTEKKKPPTFDRFPAARAKILKQAWVEKAKIKSKWKAEKRKMGLIPAVKPTHRRDDEEEEEEENADEEASKGNPEEIPSSRQETRTMNESRDQRKLSRNPTGSQSKPRGAPAPKGKDTPQQEVDLRELTRKAYSRESLHTYKSDPLNRRSHGEHGQKKGGGRGQPNMKLRMNVMLEKIKRDYS